MSENEGNSETTTTETTKGSSEATTGVEKKCAEEFMVSDQFKIMMEPVFDAVKRVLTERHKNLERWNENDERNFSNIFGVSGNTFITGKYSARDVKGLLEEKVEARIFMKEGIERLLRICDQISFDTRKCVDGLNLYGNFVNSTHISPGSARVNEQQTIGISPSEYKDKLRIEILQNFKRKKPFGHDSRVSTICHELSHFCRYYVDSMHCGGLRTYDLPTIDFVPDYNYDLYATNLVKAHDVDVFNNSYNIERYFEITA